MKKSFRSFLAIVLALACVASVAACGGSSTSTAPAASGNAPAASTEAPKDDGKVYTIRLANTAAYPSQPNWIMREFESRIEAATDRIDVELYEAGAFGGNNEQVQGLQSGALQGTLLPSGFFGNCAPAIGVLELPGLFKDASEIAWCLNQDTPALDAYLNQQGMTPIAWMYEADNNFLTTSKISSVADFAGKNIRTYSVDVSQEKVKALGANPIQMPTPDLPMGLQQKTIDGVESCPNMLGPAKLYEFAPYYLQGFGDPIPNPIMFNTEFLESLPEDLYTLVVDTMYDICMNDGWDYAVEISETNLQGMIDGGTEVLYCTPEMDADYLEATAGVTPWFLKQYPEMQAVYDEMVALTEQYRANNAK